MFFDFWFGKSKLKDLGAGKMNNRVSVFKINQWYYLIEFQNR
jgi:hypothetical protein